MERSFFGIAATDLAAGAGNAIEVCLAITAEDRVALMADEASSAVAASLATALESVGARWNGVLVERTATRPLQRAPGAVLDILQSADAGILCVQPGEGELGARMEIVSLVERRRIRYAHMVGVTPEIMRQGMRADYRRVDALSQRLCERMRQAERLRVTTPAGTSFTASFDPSLAWIKTTGPISSRYWSTLPAGEVFTPPASVDGTFVCNATTGDYFGPNSRALNATPLV